MRSAGSPTLATIDDTNNRSKSIGQGLEEAVTATEDRAHPWTNEPIEVRIGRMVGVGLLAWMGWIHLHNWSDGYKHLHLVGPLFLANFVAAVALGLALLAVPARLVWVVAITGALLAAATLAGLGISINYGLFGFTDYLNGPFVRLSIWVESAAFVMLVATALRSGLARLSR
jgi:hypothetical protein